MAPMSWSVLAKLTKIGIHHLLARKAIYYLCLISVALGLIVAPFDGCWKLLVFPLVFAGLQLIMIGFSPKTYQQAKHKIMSGFDGTSIILIFSAAIVIIPFLYLKEINIVNTVFYLLSNWLFPCLAVTFFIVTIKWKSMRFKQGYSLLNLLLVIGLITFSSISSFAQKEVYDPHRSFSKEQILEDFEVLYSSIQSVHADPFLYTEKERFDQVYDSLKLAIHDNMSEMEFHILVRKLMVHLKCGHSFAKPSDGWYKEFRSKISFIPIMVKKLEDKFYISNVLEGIEGVEIGQEVIAINDMPISKIFQDMYDIQQRDGYNMTFPDAYIEYLFRSYFLFLYGAKDEFQIELLLNAPHTVVLNAGKGKMKLRDTLELPSTFEIVKKNNWATFAMDTINQISVLKIKSFSDRKEYKKFYKSVFATLKEFPNHQLIVDLQDNTGGYFIHGNVFLSYLTPEKFEFNFKRRKGSKPSNKHTKMDFWSTATKNAFASKPVKYREKGFKTVTFSYKPQKDLFRGKIHVITDGITFSMAAVVASQLKANGALIYGTETGGGESLTNANLQYKLIMPNTKVESILPHYQVMVNSKNENTGRGVMPHFPINPILIQSENYVINMVVDQIKNKNVMGAI